MSRFFRGAVALVAAAGGLGAASTAHATYFVRPVLQYQGSMVDGLDLNGATTASQTFNDGATSLEAHVDLGAGEILVYNERYGPSDDFTISTAIMGDQIRYTGTEDVPVDFYFDIHSEIYADQFFTGTPEEMDSRYIGIEAHFAIYEASAGATYDDWTIYGTNAEKALYVGADIVTFQDLGDSFYEDYYSTLGDSLLLTSGGYYDIFAAFNLLVTPGSMEGSITMDGLNTGQIGIDALAGEFTSESGEFLGFAPTPSVPGAVPEPATWAMMLLGFFGMGGAMRRAKKKGITVSYA